MTFRLASPGGSRERLVQSSGLEPAQGLVPGVAQGEVCDQHSAAIQEDLSWPSSKAARRRRRVSGAKVLRRSGYRETAFRAVAQSLAMGAVLLAVVHVAGTSTDVAAGVPVPAATRGAASGTSVGAAGAAGVAGSGALLVDLATTEKRLVVPPVRLPMFEAGAYFTYSGAKQAAASFSASGVQTTIAGAGPYTLLVAPYYGAKERVQAIERLLSRAEVPYFVRPFTAGAVAVALPPALGPHAGALERLLIADEQVLWRLVGGAGSAAKGRGLWAASRTAAETVGFGAAVSPTAGIIGQELQKFDAAVQRAWAEQGAGLAEQTAQTQALAVLAAMR